MIGMKGKMPKGTGCDGCRFQTSTCEQLDACTCYLFEGTVHNFHNERNKDCPIVGEIPDKHGRLVDADFIISCLEEIKDQFPQTYKIIKGILDRTPTILEATK